MALGDVSIPGYLYISDALPRQSRVPGLCLLAEPGVIAQAEETGAPKRVRKSQFLAAENLGHGELVGKP